MSNGADGELVHLTITEGVATITLDSPANRNALSRQLVTDLTAALDATDAGVAGGSVRAIVLTHAAPAFCAGADLKERRRGPADSTGLVRVLQRLIESPVPTIAALTGPARAGGIGLMASCDLVVVHRDVTFALTEVRIGVAAAIITVPIFRRASPSKLAAAFLTGETFSADAARDAGLVTHVTDDVAGTVRALYEGIRLGAPGAVTTTKELLRGALGPGDLAEHFARMQALSDRLFSGPEGAEGMAAFLEKRPPSWQRPEFP